MLGAVAALAATLAFANGAAATIPTASASTVQIVTATYRSPPAPTTPRDSHDGRGAATERRHSTWDRKRHSACATAEIDFCDENGVGRVEPYDEIANSAGSSGFRVTATSGPHKALMRTPGGAMAPR
jgi:hypothetical protein